MVPSVIRISSLIPNHRIQTFHKRSVVAPSAALLHSLIVVGLGRTGLSEEHKTTKENEHRAEENKDMEEDAEAFAFYLLHRFPLDEPPGYTNRRIGALKRKYDGVKIR